MKTKTHDHRRPGHAGSPLSRHLTRRRLVEDTDHRIVISYRVHSRSTIASRQEPHGIVVPRHERHPRRPSQSVGDTETPFANTRIQSTFVGFSLVNSLRQPKRLPQMTTAWQHTSANIRRPPLQQNLGHWFRGRLTPEILSVPPPPCDPRHLLPASELPSSPTYFPGRLPIRRVFTEPPGSVPRRRAGAHLVIPTLPLFTVTATILQFPPKPRPTTCPVPTKHVPREPPVIGPPPFPPNRHRFSPRTQG